MKNYAHLIFVDSHANHNKYYEAIENDDGSIDVKYGRVGSSPMFHHYEKGEKRFGTLVSEKERKGYKNDTRNHSERVILGNADSTPFDYKKAEDEETEKIFRYLLQKTRSTVKQNYTVKTEEVTKNMLYSAEYLLDTLRSYADSSNSSIYCFNETLQELFETIPRKMSDVEACKCHSVLEMDRIVDKEEKLFSALKTAYLMSQKEKELKEKIEARAETKEMTIPEALGLSVRPVTYEEEKEIRKLLGSFSEADFTALRIVNHKSHFAFEKCRQEMNIPDLGTRLLFHGSGAENWLSILEKSLVVNADRLGLAKGCAKGLGNGIYFADDISKSLNYTHGRGDSPFIGIYNVAVGKMWDTNGEYIGHTRRNGANFGFNDLKDGCQSVFLDGKKINSYHLNEYCVYKSEQADIKYLLQCNGTRKKDVRFSMRLELVFKDMETDEGYITGKVDNLTAYAKKELGKLINVPGGTLIDEVSGAIDISTGRFSLAINGTEVSLKRDETERLSHDFKSSFFKSEKEYRAYVSEMKKEDRSVENEEYERD